MIRKNELAMLYYPDAEDKKKARERLMYEIRKCRSLMAELRKTGYHEKCWTLTPRQVEIIKTYLGDP